MKRKMLTEKQLIERFGNFRRNCEFGWTDMMDTLFGEVAWEVTSDCCYFRADNYTWEVPREYTEDCLNFIPFFEAL